jgi:hypothetical protein
VASLRHEPLSLRHEALSLRHEALSFADVFTEDQN